MTEIREYTAHNYQIKPLPQTQEEIRYRCPDCKTDVGAIKHGQTVSCPKCKLQITLWGNGLECVTAQP